MCEQSTYRAVHGIDGPVDEAHAVLASLLHCAVATDPLSCPEGFLAARSYGLIAGVNPTPTQAGIALLTMLGVSR